MIAADRALELLRSVPQVISAVAMVDVDGRAAAITIHWRSTVRYAQSATRSVRSALRNEGVRCDIVHCGARDINDLSSQIRVSAPCSSSRVSHAKRYAIMATQEQLDVGSLIPRRRTGPRYWSAVAMEAARGNPGESRSERMRRAVAIVGISEQMTRIASRGAAFVLGAR